jgi:hypothetical protein
MRHLLRRALPLLAVGTLLGLAAPTPAHAHTDVCTGEFVLVASGGLGTAINGTANTSFSLSGVAAACTSGGTFSAGGTFTGDCTVAAGAGVTNSGHAFTFQLASVMVVTGGATGTLAVVEEPLDSGSCFNNTARAFLLVGSVVLNH